MKNAMNGEHITPLTSPDTASGIAGAKAISRTRSRCNISHLCSWRRGFGNGYVLEVMYPAFPRLGKLDRPQKLRGPIKSVVRRDAACKAELSTATTLTAGYPGAASGASAACRATYHSTRPVTDSEMDDLACTRLGPGRLRVHGVQIPEGPGFQPQGRRKLTRRR
jgi:hypothetical protein